jgi:hypothetical protein
MSGSAENPPKRRLEKTQNETADNLPVADARRGDGSNAEAILKEAGAAGGADNTAVPAGGNPTHDEHQSQRKRTAETQAAKEEYQTEETESDTGVGAV